MAKQNHVTNGALMAYPGYNLTYAPNILHYGISMYVCVSERKGRKVYASGVGKCKTDMKAIYKFDKHWVQNELVMACDEGKQKMPFAPTPLWTDVKDAVDGDEAASRGLKSVIDTMDGINSAILEYKEAHCSSRNSAASTAPRVGACVDRMSTCGNWSQDGECTDVHLADFMKATCCASCRQTTASTTADTSAPVRSPDSSGACVDSHESCTDWMMKGECDKNRKFMEAQCRKSCGTCDHENGIATKPVTGSSSTQSLVTRRGEAATSDTSAAGGGGASAHDSEADKQHTSHQEDAGKQYQMQVMGHLGLDEGTAERRKHEEEEELQENLRKRNEELRQKHVKSESERYDDVVEWNGKRPPGAVGIYPAPPTQLEEAQDFMDGVVADAISVFDDVYESLPPSPFLSLFSSSSSSRRVITRNVHVGHLHDLHSFGIFATMAMVCVMLGIAFLIFGRRRKSSRRSRYADGIDPFDVMRERHLRSPSARGKSKSKV